jgi:hypothetical protein
MNYKLGMLQDDQWVEYSHPPVFERQDMAGGHGERLHVGVPGGDPEIIRSLLQCLEAPFFLLYILHTPRGEGEPGRYQSPELAQEQVEAFLSRYANFLQSDGRFDLWAHSATSGGTIVWDRHNIVYAYGPLDCYETQLRRLDFVTGSPTIAVPHQHHYRAEFDADARAILEEWSWCRTSLQPQDEQ